MQFLSLKLQKILDKALYRSATIIPENRYCGNCVFKSKTLYDKDGEIQSNYGKRKVARYICEISLYKKVLISDYCNKWRFKNV